MIRRTGRKKTERRERRKRKERKLTGGGEGEAVASGSSGNDYRPFILLSIWSMNDFLSKM